MARVSNNLTPDEMKPLVRTTLQQGDRFRLGVVQSQRRILSRRARKLLTRPAITNSPMSGRGSLFKKFSPMWRALTTSQKNVYRDAGAVSGLTNWQLYISDNAIRLRTSQPLEVPPVTTWQVRTGYFSINSPSEHVLITQEHKLDYLITRKMKGMPWKEELATIREFLGLPLTLGIRYKSNLIAEGSTQRVRYFADIWYSYQGVDLIKTLEINIDPVADWDYHTVTLSSIRGIIIGYTLKIEIFGYTGTLLFDNLRAIHGGQNWVRDPRCDNVTRIFQKQFSDVLPYWKQEILPSDVEFATVFPPALE
jgi:hypothetical protein